MALLIVLSILTMISITGVSFVYWGTGAAPGDVTGVVLANGGQVDAWFPEPVVTLIGTSSVADVPPRGTNPGTRFVAHSLADAAPIVGWVEDARTGGVTFVDRADPVLDAAYVEAEDVPGGIEILTDIADRLGRTCDCADAVSALDEYARQPSVGPKVLIGTSARLPASLIVYVIER